MIKNINNIKINKKISKIEVIVLRLNKLWKLKEVLKETKQIQNKKKKKLI